MKVLDAILDLILRDLIISIAVYCRHLNATSSMDKVLSPPLSATAVTAG
jgi:hypothetical protein